MEKVKSRKLFCRNDTRYSYYLISKANIFANVDTDITIYAHKVTIENG